MLWKRQTEDQEYIIHNLEQIQSFTEDADIQLFEESQLKAQVKYDKIKERLPQAIVKRYGIQLQNIKISDTGGQLEILLDTVTPQGDHYEIPTYIKKMVQTINNEYAIKQLTDKEIKQLMDKVSGFIPEDLYTDTQELLTSLTYKNDIQLITQMKRILDVWVELDGLQGELVYTPYGFELDYGLDHPIIIHTGRYGKHAIEVDRTYYTQIQPLDTLYKKVESLLEVICEYNHWLNPLDATYTTNKTLGDERILVTLKDERIIEYQKFIESELARLQQHEPLILWIKKTFSHNTRSVYVDVEFKRGIEPFRFTIRDHDKTYEEDIPVIRVNTLRAKNIVERSRQLIQDHINNQT